MKPLATATELLTRTGLEPRATLLRAAAPCADAVAWALLERHLLAGHVDLAVLLNQGRSRERLRASVMADAAWPDGWDQAARAVAAWLWPANPVAEAQQLSLEWDCRPDPAPPFPFVTFERAAGVASAPERVLRIAQAFAEVVEGRCLTAVDLEVVKHLPALGSALHFACPGARVGGARRWVCAVPPPEVARYLEALAWPGDRAMVDRYARRWGADASHVSLHFDALETGLGARLGLEVFHPGPPRTDARWSPLMTDLRQLRLAAEGTLEPLADWPGDHDGLVRLLDMKVVFGPDRPLEGKAYLAFCASHEFGPGA